MHLQKLPLWTTDALYEILDRTVEQFKILFLAEVELEQSHVSSANLPFIPAAQVISTIAPSAKGNVWFAVMSNPFISVYGEKN